MDGGAIGPARPALADVLVALWNGIESMSLRPGARGGGYRWRAVGSDYDFGTNSLLLVSGQIQCPADHWWVTEDPREAMELLQTRGIGPPDDERRGFDARRSFERVTRHMPPARGGSAADDGFVVELVGYPENWQAPTVELRRGGVSRRAQMADTDDDESHPRYSVESTLLGLAAAWPEPRNIHDLVAYTSLGRERIATAEALAWHGAHLLTLRPKVLVWRVSTGLMQTDTMTWQIDRMRVNAKTAGVSAPCDELYAMGILWVSGDDHAITLCVPPIS